MNPAELNYQIVSTFEKGEYPNMEPGKKYRQFLTGLVGEWPWCVVN
jgi:hypothetical protein